MGEHTVFIENTKAPPDRFEGWIRFREILASLSGDYINAQIRYTVLQEYELGRVPFDVAMDPIQNHYPASQELFLERMITHFSHTLGEEDSKPEQILQIPATTPLHEIQSSYQLIQDEEKPDSSEQLRWILQEAFPIKEYPQIGGNLYSTLHRLATVGYLPKAIYNPDLSKEKFIRYVSEAFIRHEILYASGSGKNLSVEDTEKIVNILMVDRRYDITCKDLLERRERVVRAITKVTG